MQNTANLQNIIETHFPEISSFTPENAPATLINAVEDVMSLLDHGEIRIVNKINGSWHINQWAKKAILLSFRISPAQVVPAEYTQFFDKVPMKFAKYTTNDFTELSSRVVPHAIVRRGAYIGKQVILMPSYVNIGAYVDDNTMIDTWATVGSCAYIGKNVHLSGGVGIGGVLEPLQAQPTIIEDNCFIGARSEIVEGVRVGEGSVISMGVFIGQSTKIYDRTTGEIHYGEVPPGSVVVAGNLPTKDNSHSLYCAVIVKRVDAKTRAKVSINELLRD